MSLELNLSWLLPNMEGKGLSTTPMGSHHYMCGSTCLWVIQASVQELNIIRYYNLSVVSNRHLVLTRLFLICTHFYLTTHPHNHVICYMIINTMTSPTHHTFVSAWMVPHDVT